MLTHLHYAVPSLAPPMRLPDADATGQRHAQGMVDCTLLIAHRAETAMLEQPAGTVRSFCTWSAPQNSFRPPLLPVLNSCHGRAICRNASAPTPLAQSMYKFLRAAVPAAACSLAVRQCASTQHSPAKQHGMLRGPDRTSESAPPVNSRMYASCIHSRCLSASSASDALRALGSFSCRTAQ